MNIIPSQTTAASAPINLTGKSLNFSPALAPPVTLAANGLAGAEVVAIEVSSDEGVTYAPALDVATGAPIELSATKNIINLNSFGMYRVVKGVTVAAVAVSVSNVANL